MRIPSRLAVAALHAAGKMPVRVVVGSCIALVAMSAQVQAQDPFVVQFERGYGTSHTEGGRYGVSTADQGFIAVGGASGAHGRILAVKTDANGELEWQKTYTAGTRDLTDGGVLQANDGGFVIAATIDPSPLSASAGTTDAMMIKVDQNGVEQWRTVFGGSGYDVIYNVVLAGDGSFVGAGRTESPEITGLGTGPGITYVVRVSPTGTVLDQKVFQQSMPAVPFEEAYNLVKTPDGGFMITGADYNTGLTYLMKLDASLAKVWSAFYGTGSDSILTIDNTPDGGFIASGFDYNNEDGLLVKFDPNPGPNDPVVVRAGWPKTYGTPTLYEILDSVVAATDGGYVAAGHRQVDPDPNSDHVWAVKVDANGNLVRDGVFAEGLGYVAGRAATADNYFVVGSSVSLPSAPGGDDLYLLKLLDISNPGVVAGTVYFDEDATCTLTGEEGGTRFRMVKLVDTSSTAFLTMTDASGNYTAELPSGDYTVTLAPNAVNEEPPSCGIGGQSYAVSVGVNTTQGEKNFASICECRITDNLSGGPLPPPDQFTCPGSATPSTPCPGYPWEICYEATNLCDKLHADNNGNFVEACVDLPPGLEYDYTTNPHSLALSSGCNGIWYVSSSSTSQVCFQQNNPYSFINSCTRHICFPVTVTAAFVGGEVTAQFTTNQCAAFPPTPPLDYGDTTCACDPNAMHVTPAGCGASGAITSQELRYRVDFQNLGAGPAHDVVITDNLDADLDFDTFHVIDSSHAITGLQLSPTGELVVTFAGIELPAEVTDAEGSKGHVTFAATPTDPFVDGTEIDNGASIVFDTNAPVLTNTVVNTLYHGDPVPVVDFSETATASHADFTYTGGTTGATFAWDFGPTATPRTSTAQNPAGVEFPGPVGHNGPVPVQLVATKAGCSAHAVKSIEPPCSAASAWTETAFRRPLGAGPRRSGSHLSVQFELSYNGQPVTTQSQLDAILTSDFAWVPNGDCWPRVRVFTDDLQQELALDPVTDFVRSADTCFHFQRNGRLKAKLTLNPAKYSPGAAYRVFAENYTCTVGPLNNRFEMKP